MWILLSLSIVVGIGQRAFVRADDVYVSQEGKDASGCGTSKNTCQTLRFAIGSSSAGTNIFVEGDRGFELELGPIEVKYNMSIHPFRSSYVSLENCSKNSGLFHVVKDLTSNVSTSLTLDRFRVVNCPSRKFVYLEDAQLNIVNSTFQNSGVLAKHGQISPTGNCENIILSISRSKFDMNYMKQPYEEALSLFGCNFISLTVSNSMFTSSPISIDARVQEVSVTNVNFINKPLASHFFKSSLSDRANLISFVNCSFVAYSKMKVYPILILVSGKESCNESIIKFNNVYLSARNDASGGVLNISPKLPQEKVANVKVVLKNCTFVDSSASNDGGGVYVKGIQSLTMNRCIFLNNTASNGGAIYAEKVENLQIINSTFENNSATSNDYASRGGAACISFCGLSITSSYFLNNTSVFEGKSLFVHRSVYSFVSTSTFTMHQESNSSPGNPILVFKTCIPDHTYVNMSDVTVLAGEPNEYTSSLSLMTAEGKIKTKNVVTKCPDTYKLKQFSIIPEVPSYYKYKLVSFWCQKLNSF